jgi:hypothetical protein
LKPLFSLIIFIASGFGEFDELLQAVTKRNTAVNDSLESINSDYLPTFQCYAPENTFAIGCLILPIIFAWPLKRIRFALGSK